MIKSIIVMKKIKLFLLIIFMSINLLGQNEYTYENYGIVNKNSNGSILLVNDTLIISKVKDNIIIKLHNSSLPKTPIYTFKVKFKEYDEGIEQYIYTGEVILKKEVHCQCLINSTQELDVFLKNCGSDLNEINSYNTWNPYATFIIHFQGKNYPEKIGTDIFIMDDTSIKIHIVKNQTESEKQEELSKLEVIRSNLTYIDKLLSETKFEEKLLQLKIKLKEHCQKMMIETLKQNDIPYNSITNWINASTTVKIEGEFTFYINEDKQIKYIKEYVRYGGDYFFNELFKDHITGFFYSNNVDYDPRMYSFIDHYDVLEHFGRKDIDTSIFRKYGYTFYKVNNGFLINGITLNQHINVKSNILGVKLKKGELIYYTNGSIIPQVIKDWCTKNITNKGLHFINYTFIDNIFVCKVLNIEESMKKSILTLFKD